MSQSHSPAIPRRTIVIPGGRLLRRASGAYAGLVTLCVLQAWVWGMSGLAKVASHTFTNQFAAFVSGSIRPSAPGWYDAFLRDVVLRAPSLFAVGAMVTELALSLAFLVGAALLLLPEPRRVRPVLLGVLAGSLVGVLFAANLGLLNGDPAPWQLAMSPFVSGVPVEYLLSGVGLATAASAAVLLQRTRYLRRSPSRAAAEPATPAGILGR